MKYKITISLSVLLWCSSIVAQNDSLAGYLEVAARNNPVVKSDFMIYRASLEKIPQAGAISDPELEMGFFVKPMEIMDGKQIADFKLMQMFPWFGTLKAARSEAAEMARMSYEKFRETRDNLFLEVKSSWHTLSSLQQQLINVRENKLLLTTLRELAVQRFSAPSLSASGNTSSSVAVSSAPAAQPSVSGGMAGMGQSGTSANTAAKTPRSSGMGQMSGGGMNSVSGGMSDVFRIDMELNELENQEHAVLSQITSARAKFNVLLGRPVSAGIFIPDSIAQIDFMLNDSVMMETILRQNPMLRMAGAEADAYRAKQRMDKKMGLPMIGIGLQYSLIGKRMDMGMPTTSMNGKDMVMPMVSVTLPIYRRKYTSRQAESRLLMEAAHEKFQNTLNGLTSEYISAREQLADAGRKVELYEKQQQLASATYQLAVREFASGMNSMTGVLEIERQLLDYKFKRSEAIANYNIVVAMIENLLSEPQKVD